MINTKSRALNWIEKLFLSDEMKTAYNEVLD